MDIKWFLKLLKGNTELNYFLVCSSELGINLLIQRALSGVCSPEDIHFFDARNVTKEKARQIEVTARYAPAGSSKSQFFYIYRMEGLPTDSVGPLLKVVEEAKYSRFIFQSQLIEKKLRTLMSRASVVRLPFLSKDVVLANIKAMQHDAKLANDLDLYDGTISGTLKSLGMKDTLTAIKRELKRGVRGLSSLYGEDVLSSIAFDQATVETFTEREKAFIARNRTNSRLKLALASAMVRK